MLSREWETLSLSTFVVYAPSLSTPFPSLWERNDETESRLPPENIMDNDCDDSLLVSSPQFSCFFFNGLTWPLILTLKQKGKKDSLLKKVDCLPPPFSWIFSYIFSCILNFLLCCSSSSSFHSCLHSLGNFLSDASSYSSLSSWQLFLLRIFLTPNKFPCKLWSHLFSHSCNERVEKTRQMVIKDTSFVKTAV